MSSIVEKVTDTVKDVTASLGNTSISDKATSGGDKAGKDAQTDAVLASAAEGRRLYIGNLAYATTEGELMNFFKGYLVESTSIPKNPRTDRPVGYAFVDLSTPSEAERAIAELSGKEILERKVSVQLARKPEQPGEKSERTEKADKGDGAVSGGEAGGEGHRRRASGRGRGRGRGRGARGGRAGGPGGHEEQGEEATGAAAPATSEVLPLTDVTNQQTPTDKTKEAKETKKDAPRVPRERRERGPPADGIPSKTKVMVANLPYDLSEEKLKDLFAAYEPSSAKIALRPIPRFMVKKLQARNEPRKGRGFDFVTLASEEMQKKAVAEMNGKEIEGREIAVKVAIDSPDKTDEEANIPAAEGAAEHANGTSDTFATA